MLTLNVVYTVASYYYLKYKSFLQALVVRGRNNSSISGSQQDYLVGKSGSPQIYLVVIWPRFKQNNMTKKIDQYSQYFW